MRNVPGGRICRNDDERHPESQLVGIVSLRLDVVVPATPIIPRNKDRRVVPILRLSDGVDDACNPVRTLSLIISRMVGIRSRRRDPRDRGKVAALNGRQYFGARPFYVIIVMPVSKNLLDRVGSVF